MLKISHRSLSFRLYPTLSATGLRHRLMLKLKFPPPLKTHKSLTLYKGYIYCEFCFLTVNAALISFWICLGVFPSICALSSSRVKSTPISSRFKLSRISESVVIVVLICLQDRQSYSNMQAKFHASIQNKKAQVASMAKWTFNRFTKE